jgi:hypothetical protein
VGDALQSAVNFRSGHQLSFFDDAHGRVMIDEGREEVKEMRGSAENCVGKTRAVVPDSVEPGRMAC